MPRFSNLSLEKKKRKIKKEKTQPPPPNPLFKKNQLTPEGKGNQEPDDTV